MLSTHHKEILQDLLLSDGTKDVDAILQKILVQRQMVDYPSKFSAITNVKYLYDDQSELTTQCHTIDSSEVLHLDFTCDGKDYSLTFEYQCEYLCTPHCGGVEEITKHKCDLVEGAFDFHPKHIPFLACIVSDIVQTNFEVASHINPQINYETVIELLSPEDDSELASPKDGSGKDIDE